MDMWDELTDDELALELELEDDELELVKERNESWRNKFGQTFDQCFDDFGNVCEGHRRRQKRLAELRDKLYVTIHDSIYLFYYTIDIRDFEDFVCFDEEWTALNDDDFEAGLEKGITVYEAFCNNTRYWAEITYVQGELIIAFFRKKGDEPIEINEAYEDAWHEYDEVWD